jgi:hypothetical protein
MNGRHGGVIFNVFKSRAALRGCLDGFGCGGTNDRDKRLSDELTMKGVADDFWFVPAKAV